MLLGGITAVFIIAYFILIISVNSGIATFANYSEIKAKELAPILSSAPTLHNIKIPEDIDYVLLDKNYRIIEKTVDENEISSVIKYATTGTNNSYNKKYMLITRENEYLVLQYYIGAQFTNKWLNSHLPSPDILLILIILMGCISVCIILTKNFSNKLKKELVPLFKATKNISNKNLEFEIGHSNIKEFEDILLSFSSMKESLKNSLEQQWKIEKIKQDQISSLSHDLKTPLTIIQGNLDLLSETDINEEQKKYINYIENSSFQMQKYIKTLIDISKTSYKYKLNKENIDTLEFLKQIKENTIILSKQKNIYVKTENKEIPKIIFADKFLLERAIMNIINNAIDHSPLSSNLYIFSSGYTDTFEIKIVDEGNGFLKEDFIHAKEEFYMADKSRNSKNHFGLGLYITECIINEHKGKLELKNSITTGGAEVIIKLPIL